ncbi:CopG family transcriptional regulator [Pseudoalteromonas sp. FUC4]|uniref:ribbon-helix-helix domain-containing protein n=1 Tax=Pseudoalteromonas sp. FUC4 TaxID=2511201 RepID=UPI0011F0CE76|nr:CopG family transcriptional regulator [Pseudoalteromonas sp. FUC4]KAA1150666.1 CopG family transcriptional regulator [Pseudoalteromonas sp. FUC4]
MSKKIQVSFSDEQIKLIHQLKGELGNSESEIIRVIVTCWLAEQGFIRSAVKEKIIHGNQVGNNNE